MLSFLACGLSTSRRQEDGQKEGRWSRGQMTQPRLQWQAAGFETLSPSHLEGKEKPIRWRFGDSPSSLPPGNHTYKANYMWLSPGGTNTQQAKLDPELVVSQPPLSPSHHVEYGTPYPVRGFPWSLPSVSVKPRCRSTWA